MLGGGEGKRCEEWCGVELGWRMVKDSGSGGW